MASIGVAISGGGHRATAWGLGSLLALTDMGLNSEVVSISSVSGGSIANGVAAHRGDFASVGVADFERAIQPAVRHLASEGLFFFGPATDGWLLGFFGLTALFVDLTFALVAATMATGRHWAPAWWLSVGVVLGGAAWLAARTFPTKVRATFAAALALAGPITAAAVSITTAGIGRLGTGVVLVLLLLATVGALWVAFGVFTGRSLVVDRAMARVHFAGPDGRPTLLRQTEGQVHHVFCASELQSGDHVYFSPRLVYGYRVGRGSPGSMTLATAVQCSSCLPGAFSPRKLGTAGFGLARPWIVDDNEPPSTPDRIVVNDGGVYDNMADQWEQGIGPRLARIGPVQEPAEQLVVVNAGKALGWSPYPKSSLANEVGGLVRTVDILYDVSTSHRRQAMVARFQASAALGRGLQGALVHIAQSPYDVPLRFQGSQDAAGARARTALAVLDTLGRTAAGWDALARSNPKVPTTLGALTVPTTADLLEHSWVLTVVNLYVILGHGEDVIADLAARADRSRFEALCR